MLFAAIAVLGCVALVGLWLGALHMMFDKPPVRLGWTGALHGLGGAVGLALLVLALRLPPPTRGALKYGAAGFGDIAAVLLGGALAAGTVIVLRRLLKSGIPLGLVAAHGLLAVCGYTLLMTYLTMLYHAP